MYPASVGAYNSESQEHIYSIELQQQTATTTQPAEETASTSPTNTKWQQPQLTEDEIVKKILTVFPDAPIMVEVARCESGLKPLADRSNLNVDVGVFQINQIHLSKLNELGLDRRNVDDNIKFARILYDESGLAPWFMSEYCWSKYL